MGARKNQLVEIIMVSCQANVNVLGTSDLTILFIYTYIYDHKISYIVCTLKAKCDRSVCVCCVFLPSLDFIRDG